MSTVGITKEWLFNLFKQLSLLSTYDLFVKLENPLNNHIVIRGESFPPGCVLTKLAVSKMDINLRTAWICDNRQPGVIIGDIKVEDNGSVSLWGYGDDSFTNLNNFLRALESLHNRKIYSELRLLKPINLMTV